MTRRPDMRIEGPSNHLDVLLQQSRAQLSDFSSMADSKANILIAASALVIPMTINYSNMPGLLWPAIIVVVCCVLTIVLATYAVMPRPPRGVVSTEDADCNLLFFGNYSRLSYAEFVKAMEQSIGEPGRAYELALREIYLHGRHLAGHKYRFLRFAYLSFMAGVVGSVVVWGILQLFD
jgi:hypothetical protein